MTRGCWQRVKKKEGLRDAASGLYLDWASQVMSLHLSLCFYLHIALLADIARLFEFLGNGLDGMSWVSCCSLQWPRAVMVEPPGRGCLCLCSCPYLCMCLCRCSFPRLLSEMYTRSWSRLLGSDKASQITGNHPMRVIRHTVSRPLNPSTTITWDTCARQTIQQHGNLSCSVAARLATRSETSQRDDAALLMTVTCSDLWRRETGHPPSLSFIFSIEQGKV